MQKLISDWFEFFRLTKFSFSGKDFWKKDVNEKFGFCFNFTQTRICMRFRRFLKYRIKMYSFVLNLQTNWLSSITGWHFWIRIVIISKSKELKTKILLDEKKAGFFFYTLHNIARLLDNKKSGHFWRGCGVGSACRSLGQGRIFTFPLKTPTYIVV